MGGGGCYGEGWNGYLSREDGPVVGGIHGRSIKVDYQRTIDER